MIDSEYVALIQDDAEGEQRFDDAAKEINDSISESPSTKQRTRKYVLMRNIAIILVVVNAILVLANVWATMALNAALPAALNIQDIKDLPVIDQWANLPPASREKIRKAKEAAAKASGSNK